MVHWVVPPRRMAVALMVASILVAGDLLVVVDGVKTRGRSVEQVTVPKPVNPKAGLLRKPLTLKILLS